MKGDDDDLDDDLGEGEELYETIDTMQPKVTSNSSNDSEPVEEGECKEYLYSMDTISGMGSTFNQQCNVALCTCMQFTGCDIHEDTNFKGSNSNEPTTNHVLNVVAFSARNTNIHKICKLCKAIFSLFQNISRAKYQFTNLRCSFEL